LVGMSVGGNFRGVISRHVKLSDYRSALKLLVAPHGRDHIVTRHKPRRENFGLILKFGYSILAMLDPTTRCLEATSLEHHRLGEFCYPPRPRKIRIA
jgi:hypothetical protein